MQPSDPCAISWTEDDVVTWLMKIKFGYEADTFKRHRIDGKALLLLNELDIECLVTKTVSMLILEAAHCMNFSNF